MATCKSEGLHLQVARQLRQVNVKLRKKSKPFKKLRKIHFQGYAFASCQTVAKNECEVGEKSKQLDKP